MSVKSYRESVLDQDIAEQIFDYHKAITIKERSSRYIRTAFDYFVQQKSESELDAFLQEMQIDRNSSIFKHIYDDENWNSYALEVFIYERLMAKFDDPYRAVWEFGVASGSGKLDQKSNLFTFKLKVAPMEVLIKKIPETTAMVTLISVTRAKMHKPRYEGRRKIKSAEVIWDYAKLPEQFKYPHWSSILAGYGIVYGLVKYRKGLACEYDITHWPVLPSDFPNFNGKIYIFDKNSKNIIEKSTGQIIANTKEGPFVIDGVTFNNGLVSVCNFQWRAESIKAKVAKATYLRSRIKREEALANLKDTITTELNKEHQQQLARYENELTQKAQIIQEKMLEIQALKVQQDGDYFLTSLLTRPLMVNRNQSDYVESDFIVRQKKTFQFRKKRSDLGGDICVTDNITLRERKYTVFINGDAMGKSMQGAGGALVLGVVFNAYLTRTKFSQHQMLKTPEHWLKDCYLDLQNVFISFDGSMYISVVIGLLDEQNGMMYYINAEHPFTVLMRDGKASFLEDELELRKIGTPGEEDNFRIRTFQLKPGDMIIAGSDGRDDLEVSTHETGRIINEDEQAFLRRVEEGRGNLKRIVVRLRKNGRFTDDLSLLRLSYRRRDIVAKITPSPEYLELFRKMTMAFRQGYNEEALALAHNCLEQFPTEYETYRYLGRVQFKLRHYNYALQNLEKYFEEVPSDTEIAYLISVAAKRSGNYEKAIDFGEVVYLRDPFYVNNLINLADAYRFVDNFARADHFLQKVLVLDSGNLYGQKLREMLKQELKAS